MEVLNYLNSINLPAMAQHHLEVITPNLEELELTMADAGTLEQYLRLYAISTQAYQLVEIEGMVISGKRHPAFDIYINSVKEQKQLANALGLNPKSRLTLKNLGAERIDEDSDPLLQLP